MLYFALTLAAALTLLVVLLRDRRQVVIFCFGIASGYPWVLIGSAMTAWLVEAGLTRSSVGYFGSIFAVYAINFLWAPLLDRVPLPGLKRLGQRRSWILLCQLLLLILTAAIGFTDPASSLLWTSVIALGIAVVSATQDVAIDAYRIEHIPREDAEGLGRGAAMATVGWWTGYALIGAIPFFLVGSKELVLGPFSIGGGLLEQWNSVYQLLAALWIPMIAVVLVARPPSASRASTNAAVDARSESKIRTAWAADKPASYATATTLFVLFSIIVWMLWSAGGRFLIEVSTLVVVGMIALALAVFAASGQRKAADFGPAAGAWLAETLFEPLQEYYSRNGVKVALSILLFVFLFKIGEAFLGRMSVVFYKEIGFSNEDIGYYSKMIGWAATVIFSIVGIQVNRIWGVFRGLLVGGIAMAASNLMFAWIASVGPNTDLLAAAVLVDGFTGAVATVAFVAFISWMTSHSYSATQYAMLASLGNLGRTTLAAMSGAMVTSLDGNWVLFFVLTAIMVIPSLVLLQFVQRKVTMS